MLRPDVKQPASDLEPDAPRRLASVSAKSGASADWRTAEALVRGPACESAMTRRPDLWRSSILLAATEIRSRLLCQFFIAGPNVVEFVLLKLLQIEQRDVSSLRHAQQFIQLHLHGLAIAILGVLNQEHHQEGDDRGRRVDDELPAVAALSQSTREHGTGRDDEGNRLTGYPARCLGEAGEPGSGLGGAHDVAPAQESMFHDEGDASPQSLLGCH
jgi:hypothetical protein